MFTPRPLTLTVLPVPTFLSAKVTSAVPVRLTLSELAVLPSVKVGAVEKLAAVVPSYSRLATAPAVDVRVSGRGVTVRLPLL